MADITYSTACSIPSPKDVYNHPLSLFTACIIARSLELFEKIEQKNYRSYIVAIAKFANENTPWSEETSSRISQAAKLLSDTMHNKGIIMHPLETAIVELLCCPNQDNFRDFSDCFCRLKTLM